MSGICDLSIGLDAAVTSQVDINPQASGGRLINAEFTAYEGEHRLGFGCNLLPTAIRAQFKGPDLVDNATGQIRKDGYKATVDTTKTVRGLSERRLRMSKEGQRDIHLLYRWPADKAFLNRAFLFPKGKAAHRDVGAFFDGVREGWAGFSPWQKVGIAECNARYAFPAKPSCTYVIGSDHVITSCTADLPGKPGVRTVAKCMLQKRNAGDGEAAVLAMLDRGLTLARSKAVGVSTAVGQQLTESGRSTPTGLWARARRHSLRSDDGNQQREALVAVDGVIIHAIWVESEGGAPPPKDLVERYFKAFGR